MLGIELPTYDDPDGPTIGEFYTDFVLNLLPSDTAAYASGRQLPTYDNPGAGRLFQIASQADAQQAIAEILHQGEGLSEANHNDGDHELAHYWRFKQVADTIADGTLNPVTDVYPVISSPKSNLDRYTPAQVQANTAFNTTYSRMLDAIQATLLTDKPDVFPAATGLMDQLGQQAAVLRNTGNVPGTQFLPGPTFEYVAEQK